jgi:5-formyltetrahydrofolate cyclo-ligase
VSIGGSLKQDKAELRRSLLKARQAMHPEVWREKSDRICTHLQAWPLLKEARTVLAYFSFRQEPDLSPLFTSSHQWGFPRCIEKTMVWHEWSPIKNSSSGPYSLQIGAYGIPEPHPDARMVNAKNVDLILVPAVACDVWGYRLGYGAGFYDRMLSTPEWANKPTIGIVFEFARLPKIPINPWDRPLKALCTEAGLFLSGETI